MRKRGSGYVSADLCGCVTALYIYTYVQLEIFEIRKSDRLSELMYHYAGSEFYTVVALQNVNLCDKTIYMKYW